MSQLTPNNTPVGHPGGDMAALLAEAEWLCQAVAGRDLAGIPIYMVPQSSLPPDWGSADRCFGYTTPSLDLYLREHISEWRGRGPAVVINDVALAEDFEWRRPGVPHAGHGAARARPHSRPASPVRRSHRRRDGANRL